MSTSSLDDKVVQFPAGWVKGQIFSKLNIHAQSSSLAVPKVASDDLLLQLDDKEILLFLIQVIYWAPWI